ncbi:pentapeptide repeat-containing protein [Yersinia enterocolitica]|uniref:pentapeptide repeat-containing protein n=1 Tax=Yersinia enterocolitica TaxID=630 RepID=UPI001C8E9299|nr:pentapeptide repeat-containing protein [Yersinia enterocolitica]MBX9486222.1 pentapeptide repeat-containing protein [Yersinia enterocolitica]MBX9490463.1 pentapeptide repeat-containing protein [Yersinia enterocolitica]
MELSNIHMNSVPEPMSAQNDGGAVSPLEVQECVQHLFSYDGDRELTEQDNRFAEAISTALSHHSEINVYQCKIPETLIVDFSGYEIKFSQPGEQLNSAGCVNVEVSKGGITSISTVDQAMFRHVSTALRISNLNGITPPLPIIFSDTGGLDLSGEDLSGKDLSGACLSWDKLCNANLSGADLRGAELFGTDLRGANLRGADLSWADLRGANLEGADLTEAILVNTAGMTVIGPQHLDR